jgi:DNA-binding FrmR family transcriptional regulator
MKTAEAISEWDRVTGQIKAFGQVQKWIEPGAANSRVLEQLAAELQALTDRKLELETELESHLCELLKEVGLVKAPPEMKAQWESFAGGSSVPELIRVLVQVRDSKTAIHEFLNCMRPIDE